MEISARVGDDLEAISFTCGILVVTGDEMMRLAAMSLLDLELLIVVSAAIVCCIVSPSVDERLGDLNKSVVEMLEGNK